MFSGTNTKNTSVNSLSVFMSTGYKIGIVTVPVGSESEVSLTYAAT